MVDSQTGNSSGDTSPARDQGLGGPAESESAAGHGWRRSHANALSSRPPLTDSPWFWAYVFGAAALVALFLAGPRYSGRQPQLERQFLARQEGGQAVTGSEGPVPPSTPENMIIPLEPLFLICAVVFVTAWIGLWYRRFRQRTLVQDAER